MSSCLQLKSGREPGGRSAGLVEKEEKVNIRKTFLRGEELLVKLLGPYLRVWTLIGRWAHFIMKLYMSCFIAEILGFSVKYNHINLGKLFKLSTSFLLKKKNTTFLSVTKKEIRYMKIPSIMCGT